MPDGHDATGRDAGAGDDRSARPEPKVGLWHRLLLALPSAKRGEERRSLGERLSGAVLKPTDHDAAAPDGVGSRHDASLEELEAEAKSLSDQERLFGLVAAPLSAAIALVVVSSQISYARNHGQGVSVFHVEELVLLVMSVVMMAASWYRKRLLLGITMALYGLTFFNLRWWGFGIPFLAGGAYFMVRAYRAQRAVKDAAAGGGGPAGGSDGGRPGQSKRYTPPTASKKRNPQDRRRAG